MKTLKKCFIWNLLKYLIGISVSIVLLALVVLTPIYFTVVMFKESTQFLENKESMFLKIIELGKINITYLPNAFIVAFGYSFFSFVVVSSFIALFKAKISKEKFEKIFIFLYTLTLVAFLNLVLLIWLDESSFTVIVSAVSFLALLWSPTKSLVVRWF